MFRALRIAWAPEQGHGLHPQIKPNRTVATVNHPYLGEICRASGRTFN